MSAGYCMSWNIKRWKPSKLNTVKASTSFKQEGETGSSLTRALSHGGAASVHMGYFKILSPERWQLLS